MFENIQYERKSGFVSLIEKLLCIMFTISDYFFMKMHPCLINDLAYTLLGSCSVHLSVRLSVRPFVRPSIWPSIRLSALNLLSGAYILFILRPILLILYPQSAFWYRVYSNIEPFWRSKVKVIAELYKKEKPCLEHIFSLLDPI